MRVAMALFQVKTVKGRTPIQSSLFLALRIDQPLGSISPESPLIYA